jgi:hypothetical protein
MDGDVAETNEADTCTFRGYLQFNFLLGLRDFPMIEKNYHDCSSTDRPVIHNNLIKDDLICLGNSLIRILYIPRYVVDK